MDMLEKIREKVTCIRGTGRDIIRPIDSQKNEK